MMFEPVVPVNTGTSVTGIGCVEVMPIIDDRPVASRGDSCRMPIASTRPGYRRAMVAYVVGSFCPSSPIRMNRMSGKSAMSCSANSSLCCGPDGTNVFGRGSRSRNSSGPSGKP